MTCRPCSASGAGLAAAAREHLDHDHAGAAAWARARQHTEGVRRYIRLLLWVSRRDDMEQF